MHTSSMSLSRSLTREDSNTLAWALRAQQHVPWQISVARVRHIHGADGGCLVPTGFKFQAETNCSVAMSALQRSQSVLGSSKF